ncbi:MAG: hypothetical protein M1821_009141 [Bathelium mastoideum]|nr:MAG: hypothetical protein M1821_009141 [Bathelium mastoideum]
MRPFHAEQIGSLLRPSELLEFRQSLISNEAHGSIPENRKKEYEELERRCIADVVREQLTRNITSITDGEYGRILFYDGLFEKTPGFTVQQVPWSALRTDFPTTKGYLKRNYAFRSLVVATGKIVYGQSPYLDEWLYLRSLVPEEKWGQCKITMPAPTWMHMQLKPGTAFSPTSPYSSDADYFADLADVYRKEIRTLYDAGLRCIQFDDPQLTYFFNDDFLRGCQIDGQDPDELFDLYMKVYRDCLKDKPVDLHLGVHLCRGNGPQGLYFSSGSYEKIAQRIFNELDFDTFYLEYDTERAGGFEPLRFLPVDKNVVLGVVTTKKAELEDLSLLRSRVEEAVATIVKGQGRSKQEVLKNVGVSPQCGFSSGSFGGGVGVDREVMWKKLKLVQDLAQNIWGKEV